MRKNQLKQKSIKMEKNQLEQMVAQDFLCSDGLLRVNLDDIINLRQHCDFIDGCKVSGEIGQLPTIISNTLEAIRVAHTEALLVMVIMMIICSNGKGVNIEQMNMIYHVFGQLGDIDLLWGIDNRRQEMPYDISISILTGYKYF